MIFKGRNIASGDPIYSMSGAEHEIANWSEGTGDVYIKTERGDHVNAKRMPELTWNYPFISCRKPLTPTDTRTDHAPIDP